VKTGLAALVVLAALGYLAFTKEVPFRSHYEVKAAFTSANNLRTGSPVRIAGVEIGKVTAVERGGDGAVVTMRIADEGRPVHADATAKIRPRIFLEGNFFVDMTAGSPSAPELADGETIPVQQTATPVQLDEVLTALQSDTREDLQTLLDEYGRALAGGARGFNRSKRHWKPAYRDTAIVAEAMLGETERDLSGFVEHAGATAEALGRNREALRSLVTDFHTTAAAFAREDGNLRAALRELPRTLAAAQPALGELNQAFPPVRALAGELRPGVQSASPALDASLPFLRELRGLVSEPELRGLAEDLRPTVPALAALVDQSLPLHREVRRAASCQNRVILPWLHDTVPDEHFPAQGKVFEELPKPLPGLAGESRSGDANGQWFRVLAAGGKNLVTFAPGMYATTPEPLLGANPPKPQARPPLNAEAPCEDQERPDLRTKAAPPPEQKTVDTGTDLFKRRYERARGDAVGWLGRQLRLEDLDERLRVVSEDATQELIDRIARAGG
jgi:phospholipid/cholesterol/gamma-HCH transport system substrate-binding protein